MTEKGKGHLEAGIGYSRAAGGDITCCQGATENNDHQGGDRGEVGDQKDHRPISGGGPNKATGDTQRELFDGFGRRAQRNDVTGKETGMDARPVQQ